MFTRFTRLPLKRSLHTAASTARSAPSFNRTAKFVLGTSAAAAALLSWNLSSERNTLHLDSAAPLATKPASPKSSTSSSTPPLNTPPPPPSDAFVPDAPSEPDNPESEKPEGEAEAEGEAEGEAAPKSQGAYNPETGEINWDCPCLGGMAHGPCGEQFKEAFSCFVFSEDEPKGINCVDAFKRMQDCFREHPEIYADEIMADDDDEPVNGSAPTPDAEGPAKLADEPTAEIPAVADAHAEHQTQKPVPSKSKPTSSSQ